MSDEVVRASALDPRQSFLVQAPAGSGKTELLIQRYLALLATVEQPEQVVAITFTRKAAAEMRARVQRSLRAARGSEVAVEPHARATRALASAVLARDEQRDWGLLDRPARLRIDTLDAFNAWLARQLPVLADGVAATGVLERAEELYRVAARRTVAAIADNEAPIQRHLRTVAVAVDNDLERLERMLVALLPRRERWAAMLAPAAPDELRALLERMLAQLVADELATVASLCPATPLLRLVPLLRHAAAAAVGSMAAALAPWRELRALPTEGAAALAAWRGIAALLLTKQGTMRKRFTAAEGFGSEHAPRRAELIAILAELEAHTDFQQALATVGSLPDPHYTPLQWASLAALQQVLRHLLAELKVVFAERRAVDFVELAAAAQRALGHVDEPSELLLALDRRIQHLLVDEFQDTSHSQRRLLELLTAGWSPGDGRTLFLVGDPMQSIYRFRDADLALFLLAKQRGIGSVQLRIVTLERNFRSAPVLVEWVNAAFAGIFPPADDLALGRAAFRASAATRARAGTQFVRTHAVADEAAATATILAAEIARDPAQSIAVLVQSRTHLEGVRELLRARGIPAHAVEIDTLAEQQVAQDLAGLTRALLHWDDRIAWLATLRAPWCGLTWADLHALCHDDPEGAIWELAQRAERVARLSEAGRRRLQRWARVVASAIERRATLPLTRWIEQTWRALGGPDCLATLAEQQAAEQFFALLGAVTVGGDLDDPADCQRLLDVVQPQADPPAGHGVELMTIHRAKGLEFDTVVLLGLGREPRADESKALHWLPRVTRDGRDDLVVVAHSGESDSRLSDFVRRVDRGRDAAERARLLYVATTRARERLHLVWHHQPEGPEAQSMLAQLWPVVAAHAPAAAPPEPHGDGTLVRAVTPVLHRLVAPDADSASLQAARVAEAMPVRPEFAWAGETAIHVGTVVHRYLHRFADQGLAAWEGARLVELRPAIVGELELLGVERRELEGAAERVVTALAGALADPQGRWLLGPHAEAESELRVTVRPGNALEHLRLDRTFVVAGERWIVDFKTSEHQGGDRRAFVASEVTRYAPQLERYARAVAGFDSRPVRLGLYFPLLGELRTWPAATTSP